MAAESEPLGNTNSGMRDFIGLTALGTAQPAGLRPQHGGLGRKVNGSRSTPEEGKAHSRGGGGGGGAHRTPLLQSLITARWPLGGHLMLQKPINKHALSTNCSSRPVLGRVGPRRNMQGLIKQHFPATSMDTKLLQHLGPGKRLVR